MWDLIVKNQYFIYLAIRINGLYPLANTRQVLIFRNFMYLLDRFDIRCNFILLNLKLNGIELK
jgi:hypothetical protein